MNESQARAALAGYAFYRNRDIIETALAAWLLEHEDGFRCAEAAAAYDELVELLSLPTEVAA